MENQSIIIKETTSYKLTEQLEIYYVSFPQRGINKGSMRSPDINDAFNFNPKSLLLKFHPQGNSKNIHAHYGNGITKTEWIYIDKEPNDENFTKIGNERNIKINIEFPKIVIDFNNESTTYN